MSIALSLKKRAWRLRRAPVEATRLGARWLLHPRDWLDNRLLAGAPFEERQLALCRALIARNGIDLFLDVGANIGLYTVLLGRDPAVPEIHAFEPVARTAERLRQHVRLNGLEGRVTVHQLALDRATEMAVLYLDPRSTGLARRDVATASRSLSVFTASEAVRVAPLDSVLAHRGRRAFLKIDAEGAGLDILSGATAFLEGNRCAVQIETEPETEGPIAALLARLGYRSTGRVEADVYFLHPGLEPAQGPP